MLFKDLKQNLNKDFSAFPVRRLALLGDSATQFLAKAIKGYGYEEQFNFEIFDADFDQLDHQILDADSELYHFDPGYVILYLSAEKLWTTFTAIDPATRNGFADQVLSQIQNW